MAGISTLGMYGVGSRQMVAQREYKDLEPMLFRINRTSTNRWCLERYSGHADEWYQQEFYDNPAHAVEILQSRSTRYNLVLTCSGCGTHEGEITLWYRDGGATVGCRDCADEQGRQYRAIQEKVGDWSYRPVLKYAAVTFAVIVGVMALLTLGGALWR